MITIEKLPITILYVEDEEIIRLQTLRILKRFATDIIVAENGQEGFEQFARHHIDIVISDIKMPIMAGLDMAKAIRETNKTVPIIIMTAHTDLEKLLEAIQIGVNDFLIKPIDVEKLEDRIRKYSREMELALKLRNQALRFQAMLDFQDNMLILTDGKQVLEANQSFMDFIGHSAMLSLRDNEKCIDDMFVNEDGFIQKKDDHSWIESLLDGKFAYNMVKIRDKHLIERVFLVKAKSFAYGENQYVVSFMDATDYEKERKNLEVLANTDALTKIANRMRFSNMLDAEIESAQRTYAIFSVAMFDIDYFKKINDAYGHDIGDEVLISISETAKSSTRATDELARWGGEEFMILFPNVNKDGALTLCERLRKLIEQVDFPSIGSVTCSFGITEYIYGEAKSSLLKRVDEALYEAKHNGRNCCKVR